MSNIESCTEESRLLLSFQACPDVQGTESTGESLSSNNDSSPFSFAQDEHPSFRFSSSHVFVPDPAVEELTCLATWKDGNSRYLVGLVSHHHAISNEERYRCFVYEKISSLMGKRRSLIPHLSQPLASRPLKPSGKQDELLFET